MLPQFGYIVAQAGADARLPSHTGPPSGLPPPPPHSSGSNAMPNQYRHDTSSATPPRDRSYFPRHPSPAPSSSSTSSMQPSLPVLPPPVPYMYASSDYSYQRPYYPGHPAAPTTPAVSAAVVPQQHHHQPPSQSQQQVQAPPPPPPSQSAQVMHHHQQQQQQPHRHHQQQQQHHHPSTNTTTSSTSFRPLPPKWRDEPQQLTQHQHHAPPSTITATTTTSSTTIPRTPPAPSSVWHAPTPPPPPSQQVIPPQHQQQRPPSVPPAQQQLIQQQQPPSAPLQKQSSTSSFHPPTHHDTNYDYDPYHSQYESQWDQDDQGGGGSSETHQNKKMRNLRECNDLLTTMNNEFLEHSTVIYHNKLQSLQEELRSIQEGTHEAFMEEIADLEKEREKAIFNAQCLMDYHVSGLKRRYETDVNAAEHDYELERQNLHDTIVAAIEDRRKQVKEDRDHGFDVKDLFRDAYHRVNNSRRNLRKRQHFDQRSSGASPSRHENTRRRQNRPSNMYSINGPISQREEDDLEQEFAVMKGLKRPTAAAQ